MLAGGQSRRMGRDKALVTFAGEPMIVRAVSILKKAGLETAIAGGGAELALYAPIVEDRVQAQGPLGGICAALEAMTARWAVFLPIDLPLLPPQLIRNLAGRARETGSAVTLASLAGESQTLPAVLDRAVLPTLRAHLASGRRRCSTAFEEAARTLGQPIEMVPVEKMACAECAIDFEHWFTNLNTPEDVAKAESLARPRIA